MATLYVSPAGAGLRDGSSMANAATLGSLSALISAAGPGGEVLLLADQGVYQQDVAVEITAGGDGGAPVTIRGVDSSGNTMAAEIVGTRAENWTPGQNVGVDLFRLASGADNLTFQDLSLRNIGDGAFRIGADIENLTIAHIDAENLQRFVQNQAIVTGGTATVAGLLVQDVDVAGYSHAAIRLKYDSHDITIQDVKGDSQGQDGGLYVIGVHLDGTVHDVLIQRVQMDNNLGNGAPDQYWNGDGFGTERDVYNVRFEDTSASNNTDAGYDIKSSNTVLVNAVAEGNKNNFRLWSDSITLEDSISLNPQKIGGSSSISHLWLRDGAVVTLDNFQATDSGAPTTLFDLSDGTSLLRLLDTAVPDLYADKMRMLNGSTIEIVQPAQTEPPSPTENDAPTWISVAGGVVEENSDAGTVAATLSAIDADLGDTHSFAITGGDTGKFEIVGNQIRVKAGAQLDYETRTGYVLNVLAVDQAGASHKQSVVIQLLNVGENGGSGNDVLLGGAGSDTLTGKTGNDTYLVNAAGDKVVEKSNQGTDLANVSIASYTLASYVENLTYVGNGSFTGVGNSSNNVMTGGAGNDDLSGGSGNDTLNGGAGRDRLSGSSGNDKAYGGDDADSLYGGAGNDTLFGDNGDDLLFGDDGTDTLNGGAGADRLDGGAGNDKMSGGAGNDTYVVNASKETLTELVSEGIDTVESSLAYTLGANLENLILKGSSAINGTGNELANKLTGNGAINTLNGGGGDDVLDGGGGNDNLTGGQGADTYLFGRGSGKDVITNADTDGKADKLIFGSAIDADDVWLTKSGNDLVISVVGTGDKATLKAWFNDSTSRLSELELSDGTSLAAGDVQQLVNAMSFATSPPSSLSALTTAQRNAVEAAIDATWEP